VRIRPSTEAGGIPDERAGRLKNLILQNPEADMLVELTKEAGDFELSMGPDNRIVLKGPENSPEIFTDRMIRYPTASGSMRVKEPFFILAGEGGRDFRDNETLRVSLKPAPAEDAEQML
jgi:hypothetical protein